MNNKELFEYVKSENVSEEELSKIWNTTRSVKIRKQIALNPNASPLVLEQAARLYLEEVIKNPAFQMLALFDDSSWVGNVAKAYQSPGDVIYHSMRWLRNNSNHDIFYRAGLLSDQLDTDLLDTIAIGISAASLKRAIKNSETKEKIKNVLETGIKKRKKMSLEAILILWNQGGIDNRSFLAKAICHLVDGTASASKSVYKKFFFEQLKDYKKTTSALTQEEIRFTLFSLLSKSRSHCFGWICGDYWALDLDKKTIILFAGILSDLTQISQKGRVMQCVLNDGIRYLKNILCYYFRELFLSNLSFEKKKEVVEYMYSLCESFGISKLGFSNRGVKLITEEWINVFNYLDNDDIKEFFARESVFGNWFSINFSDSKFRLIDNVNEKIYARDGLDGKLLYRECSLKKIVSLPDAHVF